jgi:hypothetical protein
MVETVYDNSIKTADTSTGVKRLMFSAFLPVFGLFSTLADRRRPHDDNGRPAGEQHPSTGRQSRICRIESPTGDQKSDMGPAAAARIFSHPPVECGATPLN